MAAGMMAAEVAEEMAEIQETTGIAESIDPRIARLPREIDTMNGTGQGRALQATAEAIEAIVLGASQMIISICRGASQETCQTCRSSHWSLSTATSCRG